MKRKVVGRLDYPIDCGWALTANPPISHTMFVASAVLVVDNGKEFHSRHFSDCCAQLGIEIDYAPPQCGWYKGALERWFGTQNTRLLHELPGTTFSNIAQRGAYDSKKHAAIAMPALLELIHTWIVDLYHQEVQRGLAAIPAQRWQNSVQQHPLRVCTRLAELDILTSCHAERRIGRAGIELFTLHYHDAALAKLRRALPPGAKVQIRYDPTDLSLIHVFDATTQRYLAVAAVEQEYTRGLTLYQHEIIRRHARQTAHASLDITALSEARAQITAIVTRECAAAPTLTRRTQAARFLSAGQASVVPVAEVKPSDATPIVIPQETDFLQALTQAELFVPETEGWSVSYDGALWQEEVAGQ